MSNLFELTDRVAIVTGAGRGIGREVARTLAKAGAHVAIAGFDPVSGQDAAQEIRDMGQQALSIQTDVRNPNSVEAIVKQFIEHFGKIDILV